MDMRIEVLVDDVVPEGVRPVHGFAALVTTAGGTILFDAGPDGDLLVEALERAGLTVADLDVLVLSHAHRDHTGGAARILFDRPRMEVSVPVGSAGRLVKSLPPSVVVRGERGRRRLAPGVWTTGDLGGDVPEQALVIEAPTGMALLTGCGHPGLEALLAAAGGPVDLLVGGLHDLSMEDLPLQKVGRVVACHCTPRKQVLAHLSGQVTLGGVGTVLELDGGP